MDGEESNGHFNTLDDLVFGSPASRALGHFLLAYTETFQQVAHAAIAANRYVVLTRCATVVRNKAYGPLRCEPFSHPEGLEHAAWFC